MFMILFLLITPFPVKWGTGVRKGLTLCLMFSVLISDLARTLIFGILVFRLWGWEIAGRHSLRGVGIWRKGNED